MMSPKLFFFLIILVNVTLGLGYLYADDEKSVPYATIRMRKRLYAKRRHRNICNPENDEKNNEKLKEAIRKSDFVFTGKVLSYYEDKLRNLEKRDGDNQEKRRRSKKTKGGQRTPASTQKPDEGNSIDVNLSLDEDRSEQFIVELKRVIKGGSELFEVDKVTVTVPKQFVSGLEITSDPTLNMNCVEFHPVLKIRQTAILLTKKINGSIYNLELTYFPVAMTLRHLDKVDAAVTGKPQKNFI